MRLHHYVDPRGNFGDDLNRLVWPALVGDVLDEDGRSLLVGIGTLLNDTLPREPLKAVMGSGAGYGRLPEVDASWPSTASVDPSPQSCCTSIRPLPSPTPHC